MCYLMDSTVKQMQLCTMNGMSRFEARNNAQVYRARDLTRAYSEYYALKSFQHRLTMPDVTDSLRPILTLVYRIYGLWCLERHLSTFYQGEFTASGTPENSFGEIVRSELLKLCGEMKDSAVAVVDALAPPDFALNSIIGKSDGLVSKTNRIEKYVHYKTNVTLYFQLYENLQNEFMTNPGSMERASWWKEVRLPIVKSKL